MNRTIMMMENGVKPVWVFDGKPPEMKMGELEKRKEKKMKAEEELKQAIEDGDEVKQKQMAQRRVHVTKEMTADAIKLIQLMGIPFVQAPGEAEAQCAVLTKADKAYATFTEDMDALTFGSTHLLRGISSKKEPAVEINLEKMLEGFGMDMDQFIDLCIMCGCDYAKTVFGVGPTKAFKYLSEHKTIEKALIQIEKDNEKRKKPMVIPEDFKYELARLMFTEPDVDDPEKFDFKWVLPDEEGMKKFLVEEKGFNATSIENAIKKLKKSKSKSNQVRLDSFFKKK